MGSESIAHESEGQMGYWLRGHEDKNAWIPMGQPTISMEIDLVVRSFSDIFSRYFVAFIIFMYNNIQFWGNFKTINQSKISMKRVDSRYS